MNLAKNIEDLLFLENDFGALRNAANDYYEFLSGIDGIGEDPENDADDMPTILRSGKAISPKAAARCVLDFARTCGFLRGIHAAAIEAKKRFPDEKIEILYAGCGPFAALALPFCLRFSSEQIRFTLLDIHQRSLDSARKIFQKLDLQEFIGAYIQTDASVFQPENAGKFHIIITETMQRALEKEPQAAITLNLAKFLCENGIFIPQKITIEACLADFGKEFSMNSEGNIERERVNLGKIFELSAESAAAGKELFSPTVLRIPAVNKNLSCFMLLTKVEIFDSFALGDYDSGITYPLLLRDISPVKAGQEIEFRYAAGENPHFEYRLI